ncbi:MAG: TonB-dependent receptor [Treponema sp.]|nr:TonB-dependent receptor [Treponema sp.]
MADSSLVTGGVTDANGVFSCNLNSNDKVFFRISSIGYETKFVAIPMTDTIRMSSLNKELSEVSVKGKRRFVKPIPKGIQVSLDNNPISKLPSILDAIKQMPLIDASTGSVSVLGKGTPIYYIDNRRVRDMNELTVLSPEEVKSVDIITRPGAKYPSDVTSVIIIHRKKKVPHTAAIVNMKGELAEVLSGSTNADFSYLNGNGLGFFAGAGYSNNGYEQERTYQEDFNNNKFHTKTNGVYNGRTKSHNFKFGSSFDFENGNSVGARYEYGKTPDTHFDANSITRTNAIANFDSIGSYYGNNGNSDRHYVNAYSDISFGKNNCYKWTTDADYISGKSGTESFTNENNGTPLRAISNGSSTNYSLIAGKTNMDWTLGQLVLTFGASVSHTKNEMSFNGETTDGSMPFQSSIDKETQNLYAGYAEFYWNINSHWMLNGGIRYESTSFEYLQNQKKIEHQSKTFNDFLPNIGFTYMVDNISMGLNYSTNVLRPSYNKLNNNYQYVSPTSWEIGNPLLKSSIHRTLEYSFMWKQSAFGAMFERNERMMNSVYTYDKTKGVNIRQEKNLPNFNSFTIYASHNMNIGLWHPTIQGALYIQDYKYGTDRKKYDKPLGQLYLNNRFDLPYGIYAYLGGSWMSKGNQGVYYQLGYTTLYAQLNKTVKQWSFTLLYNDLLNCYKQENIVETNGVRYYTHRKGASRLISLSVTYKFNKKRNFKGKGAAGKELDRLN